MDRNVLLAFALSMLVFSGWLAWQDQMYGDERRAAQERAAAVAAEAGQEEAAGGRIGDQTLGREPEAGRIPLPAAEVPTGAARQDRRYADEGSTAAGPDSSRSYAPQPDDTPDLPIWRGAFETESVRAELTSRGAALKSWTLKRWFVTPARETNIDLLDLPPPHDRALITPFEDLGLGDLSDAVYAVESEEAGRIVFALRRGGFVIRKIYEASDDAAYGFDLRIEVENGSDRIVSPGFHVVWPLAANDSPDFKEAGFLALADGEVERTAVMGIGQPGFFSNFTGGDVDEPPIFETDVQWAGVDLRYFAGILIPEEQSEPRATFVPLEPGKVGATIMWLRPAELRPGEVAQRGFQTFLGPKEPQLLATLGLEQTINRGYSWISPLTTFFEWMLHVTKPWVGNFGLAIILITVLVRLATWPIMARQMKSAERMRELMPRIKELQETYKDDRQKQSEETFKLYRETGVNPLGGCLPMVLQLPVFIGLFFALQSSIDLRHAPFMLWINDLSAPATAFTIPGVDFPVRILPILMGISMFAQQRMMPQTGMDPAQQRMMLIMMPGMMLFISYSFPSGLVLYWMVSNLLGIGHQLLVRRKMQTQGSD